MERRDELLQAAATVYALHGYRGSTTRRIADEAGVNEITIFRQFGTKDALIHEAIATCGGNSPPASLPEIPIDPLAELQDWGRQVRSHICSNRSLIRRCMSEREEHPQLIASANRGPIRAATELQKYLGRLQEHGFVDQPFDTKAPTAMLMGTLFADTMGRDVMPDIYPATPDGALRQYAELMLRAIGINSRRQPEYRVEHTNEHTNEHTTMNSGVDGAAHDAAGTSEHSDQ